MIVDKEVISVIVPVYNASHTLKKCIESLFTQSYPYLEIILVDDCSTDCCLELINSLTARQRDIVTKVKIISHDTNKGVASARNTGLESATGTYIYFVDADDYVEPYALEKLYYEIKREDADIVGCEWYLSFQTNERYMVQPTVLSGEDMFRKMAGGVMRWNLWLFLVKHSLYNENKIWFTPGMNMGEDMMVMMKLALCCQKVSVLHEGLYHYQQTNLVSLTRTYSDKHRLEVTANVNELESFVNTRCRKDYREELNFLKLNIKLPLLISSKVADYKLWLEWFPTSNDYVDRCEDVSLRVRFIQKAALKRRFWVLKAYYWLVIKIVYGIIYK